MGSVLSPTSFIRAARKIQREGGKVVFTNGVFDLLHYGHVSYLQKARRLGDALFVGVNTDQSVKRLKGAKRPLVSLDDRCRTLAALACVDAVTSFDENTPAELIARLRPDVLAKGKDYALSEIVGADAVKAAGGRVVRVPLVAGRSTTSLINKIKKSA